MVFNSIMSFTEVRPIDPIIYSWGLGALCGWGLGVLITMFFALRKWRHDDEIEAGFMGPFRDPIFLQGAGGGSFLFPPQSRYFQGGRAGEYRQKEASPPVEVRSLRVALLARCPCLQG